MTLAYQEYYTVADYTHWQGDWELIEGMPYAMSPSPSVSHQVVSTNLVAIIKNSLTANKACGSCITLMETDWHVSNDTIVRPDVMIVCNITGEKVITTPELIIEVVSSSSTKRDESMKFELYQQEGVPYYILVYPQLRLAKVYYNQGDQFNKTGDFSNKAAHFDMKTCQLSVDFSAIWR